MAAGAWAALLVLWSGVAEAGCVLGKVAELPVTMVGLGPVVNAEFNGQPVRLEAAEGASYSVISEAAAKEYHLPLKAAPLGLRVESVNGALDVEVARVAHFGLAGADIPDVQFLAGGSDLGVAGLLGRNILGNFDTEYDLGAGVIRLFHPHDCARANLAYWAAGRPLTILPMQWSDGLTPPAVVKVKVNGVAILATLDGEGPTAMTVQAARRVGIDLNSPAVVPAGVSTGMGQRIGRAWLAPIKSFEIDGETVTNTKVRIAEMDPIMADMVLGADFFLSHRVLISQSQHTVYLTYQGGQVFDLGQHLQMARPDRTSVADDDPKDADGYARRGAAELSRGDAERALADLDKAVTLGPKDARYRLQRACAQLSLHHPVRAQEDIDAALALDPADTDALLARATLREASDDRTGAIVDLKAADKAMAPEANGRLDLGELYLDMDQFDPAIAEFDVWVRYHPDDARLWQALNSRCWARALQGRDLDRALSDCNRAVRLYPGLAEVRDSRGLVQLRRGDYARAIADYDTALRMAPKTAWSLYGRGLAELRTGDAAAGHADLAAAAVIQPRLAARARKLGLAPPDESAPATASMPSPKPPPP